MQPRHDFKPNNMSERRKWNDMHVPLESIPCSLSQAPPPGTPGSRYRSYLNNLVASFDIHS
jgi:hypothetical protein